MDLQSTLLNAVATYGLVAIFLSILVSAIGIPLPTSFLLIMVGSLIEQGEMEFWPVIAVAATAAIVGDHIGYAIGWYGGHGPVLRICRRLKAEALLVKAEETSRKWGGASVFLSRWLLTAVGPYINLTSGIASYSWPRFMVWDVLGEVLWVVAYVQLGRFFNDRVAELSDALGDFTGVALGLATTAILAYMLIRNLRSSRAKQAAAQIEPTNSASVPTIAP